MKLDRSMRARLRALAGREREAGLDDAPTRVRSEQAVRSEHDARHRRRELAIHGLSLACAVALVFVVIASLEGDAPVIHRARVARREPVVVPDEHPAARGQQTPAQAAATVEACAGEANLTFSLDAHRRLDLGNRALLVANHGAVVAAKQSADCDLRVGLADGSLAVHARDLQGRALVVQTSRGEIRVKGTVFLVDFYAASGELEVGVEEGRVELVVANGKSVMLEPGQAAYLGSHLELESFDDSGRARVRRMLGLEGKRGRERASRTEQPEPGGEARGSLQQNEETAVRTWRAGAVEPPVQEPELGSRTTEDGRPPAKPKLKKRSEARSREAPSEVGSE